HDHGRATVAAARTSCGRMGLTCPRSPGACLRPVADGRRWCRARQRFDRSRPTGLPPEERSELWPAATSSAATGPNLVVAIDQLCFAVPAQGPPGPPPAAA